MKKYLIFGIMILSIFSNINAQEEIKFSVSVNLDTILLGNHFEVTFALENAKARNFEAPNFKGFDIVGGPNQSTSMSMVNGVTTRSASYSYYLKPNSVGTFYIEPAFVKAGEEDLSTEPIEVIVLDNPDGIIQKPQRKRENSMQFFNFGNDDFFNFPNTRPPNGLRKKMPNKEEQEKLKKKSKKKRKVYKI